MTYQKEDDNKVIQKTREVLKELPSFCRELFLSLGSTTTPKTRLGYAYDLKLFFGFLVQEKPEFEGRSIKSLTLKDIAELKVVDINEYLDYLSYYIKEDEDGGYAEVSNAENGKSRKLAAVRKLYNYFCKTEKLETNPAELADTPKIRQKEIIRLEPDEVARLLDSVESGLELTKGQQRFHALTKARDLAIITTLLGTGMRVSELVGIDLNDIDFGANSVVITRKGHKRMSVYFGAEVEKALKDYISLRNEMTPLEGHENALFLSLQNKRMGVRSVEKMVKKYAVNVTPQKKISPHKLRSTYGTELYKETGDIYLVADVLGHNNINTTQKHYAQQQDSNRRKAARVVKLRED